MDPVLGRRACGRDGGDVVISIAVAVAVVVVVVFVLSLPVRIITMPIQSQGIIGRDNVGVDISAVAYFRVVNAVKSVVAIENVHADAPLAIGHELLICHGDGPQVGMLSLESETDPALTRAYPLADLLAETQGMIGYWLTRALRNAGMSTPILSAVTQTLLDHADSAFDTPTKFVSRGYTHRRATELASQHGWDIATDGDLWRRVVISPEPQSIIEQNSIKHLMAARTVVICGGGGGAAVTEDGGGRLAGVEAVVGKDYVASLLAVTVHAQRLLMLTDVGAVMQHFGTSAATLLAQLSLDDLSATRFPAGSMAPKIESCRRFVNATDHRARIGALCEPSALFAGTAGTTIGSHTNKHNAQHSPV